MGRIKIKIYLADGTKIRTRSIKRLMQLIEDPEFDSATVVRPIKFPLIIEKDRFVDIYMTYQANYDPDVAAKHNLCNAYTPPKYFNQLDELKQYIAKFVSEP